MTSGAFKPIRNTDLPKSFRAIRLMLAREPGHPEGDAGTGYIILAPLDHDGRIDAALWKTHREACRVTRFHSGGDEQRGHLIHRPGGSWALRYDLGDGSEDVGYHFSDERFVVGEYVSVKEKETTHAFRVVSVAPL